MHQLSVEDRRAGGAANRVVAERDELEVQHRARAQTADGHRHAVVAIGVEHRLRPILLVEVHDRMGRRRWQIEFLRLAFEGGPRVENRAGLRRGLEADRNRSRMTVLNADARRLRADHDWMRLDAIAREAAENLLRLRLDLL